MRYEYAVILCFDLEFSNLVKKLWEKFGYDGLEPHITLGDFTNIDRDEFINDLYNFIFNRSSFSINFSSISCFPKNHTIVINPIMTKELWNLHQNFHSKFSNYTHNNDSFYLPNKWIPHCTLKSKVKEEDLNEIMEYCIKNYSFEKATVEKIKLIEFKFVDNILQERCVLKTIDLN